MSATLGAKARKLSLPGMVNAKTRAKKLHKRARQSVLAAKSGKRNPDKNREPFPGDLAFGNRNRLFADSEYDLYAPHEAYDRMAEWKRQLVAARSFIPPNRENCAAAVCGNELYMFGGLGGGPEGRYNLLCALNFNTLQWRVERPLEGVPPAPCCKHSMVCHDRCLYMYGGEGEFKGEFCRGDLRCTREIINKMFKYDTRRASWHALPTVGEPPERRIPFARRSHSAVMVPEFHSGPSVLIFAGAGLEPIKARDRLFNDMWAFNVVKDTWTFVYQTGEIPPPRAGHSATLVGGNTMFVYGGVVDSGGPAQPDGLRGTSDSLFCFDTRTLAWSAVHYSGTDEDVPGPLYNHAAVLHPWTHEEGKILVFGGRNSGSSAEPTSTVYCFDAHKNAWGVVPVNPPSSGGQRPPPGKFSMCAWTVRKCVVMFGGCNSHGYCNSDLSILALPDPPYANVQDDIMARLSKMDSREMLRGSYPSAADDTGGENPVGVGADSGANGVGGSTLIPGGGGSAILGGPATRSRSGSTGIGGSSGLSALPEEYPPGAGNNSNVVGTNSRNLGPVPSLAALRAFLPTMSYRAFKGVVGQGRSSLDCLLPTGELRATGSSVQAGGEGTDTVQQSTSNVRADDGSRAISTSPGNSVAGGGNGSRMPTSGANRSMSAPSLLPGGGGRGQGRQSFSHVGAASSTVAGGSTLSASASASSMQSGLMQGSSSMALAAAGGNQMLAPDRSSLNLLDILTLGNGSFFVDNGPLAQAEERSALSNKTWIRQHLHRSYVPPRALRSQGHIYLRGKDTRRRMALGDQDLNDLVERQAQADAERNPMRSSLSASTKRRRNRPSTSSILRRPSVSASSFRPGPTQTGVVQRANR